MFFYILMVSFLLASLYMIWFLRKMKKHDQVLYRFCHVRRETMALIREHNFNLTLEDYLALKEIAEVTSATIHDYNSCKIYVFNFRRFVAAIRRIKRLEIRVNSGQELKGDIRALQNRFADAMMFAFTTFTPFFKSERVFRVTQYTTMALARIGISRCKTAARRMTEVTSWVESQRHTPTFN